MLVGGVLWCGAPDTVGSGRWCLRGGEGQICSGDVVPQTHRFYMKQGCVLTYRNTQILKCNRVGIALIASSGYTAAELCRRSAPLASVRWERDSKRFGFFQLIYQQFIKALYLWLACDCAVRRGREITVAKNSRTCGESWDPSNKRGSVWKGLDLLVWRESWNSALQSKMLDTAPNWSSLV